MNYLYIIFTACRLLLRASTPDPHRGSVPGPCWGTFVLKPRIPHHWNQLPFSLREPVSPLYAYLNPSFCSPLSQSITPSLFHSKLKTYLFGKSFPHRSLTIEPRTDFLG